MGTATHTTVFNDDERSYRIGQVSRLTQVPPFVLRYWEEEFPMLAPGKSISGYRMYRRQDVNLVLKIKSLLYEQGFTIAGARKHLQDMVDNGTLPAVLAQAASQQEAGTGLALVDEKSVKVARKTLLELRDTLRGFLTLLERK